MFWSFSSGGYTPLQPSHHANSTLIGRFHLMNNFLQTSFREISGISGQTFFTGEGKKRPNHKCPLACKCCTSDDPCRMSIPTILWYPIYHLQVSPTVPLIMILTHICLREFIHMTILVHIVHLILVHIHICLKEYILMTIHIHIVHIHMCVKLTTPVRCSTLASFHRMLNCLSHL